MFPIYSGSRRPAVCRFMLAPWEGIPLVASSLCQEHPRRRPQDFNNYGWESDHWRNGAFVTGASIDSARLLQGLRPNMLTKWGPYLLLVRLITPPTTLTNTPPPSSLAFLAVTPDTHIKGMLLCVLRAVIFVTCDLFAVAKHKGN